MNGERKTIQLSYCTIEYEDTGGSGPVVVLLHGFLMDSSLWRGVIDSLASQCRCVAPTLPLGAHRHPVRTDADLSLRGIARLVSEFLEALNLPAVTLVGNDTGGALVQLLICENSPRIGRAVLVSCDAFDNFPPRVSGQMLVLTGRLPPAAFGAFMQQLRLRPVRRLPIAFGWLSRRGDPTTRRWLEQILTRPDIRRDTVRALRTVPTEPKLLLEAAECLRTFDRPALVVWAKEDRIMPPDHGRRLNELLPHGRLVEIDDSYTLIPLDQPIRLAEAVGAFIREADPATGA